MEREFGQQLLLEYHYFLAGQPLDNGMAIQLYRDQDWILGRFMWSGNRYEMPKLRVGDKLMLLFAEDLLRWPAK